MEVRVQPLGQRFEITPGENLLKALCDRNIPISYSCLAGRCGTCRCKVVAGEVQTQGSGHASPQGSASHERHVLACQSTVMGDCVIEVPDVDDVVVHPARIVKATVAAIEALTHDITQLVLRPAKPLAFSPGQYAMLQFTPAHIRPYSMAGLPDDEHLEFHIRRVPAGLVSRYVESELKVGDAVRVSGPLGTSYLRTRHDSPMLCVAGGTGLAPVLSIVRGAIAHGMKNPIHLYCGARTPRDVYGLDWLRAMASRHPALHLHVVTTVGDDAAAGFRSGHVTDALAGDFEALDGWRAYLCGAPPMVDAATQLLLGKGIDPAHVYADAFYAVAA
ncbi:naphthalene 1,2-dioxygenase [Pandoraea terrae]|uniref:Naphthalene 1,2-dioxygenase n=1 Tax=Pandoraea terrae TaxID=1537710 RepID=A0A5E4R7G1_9BURK|nr:2Fe-2S iron-sulfur cluster-binding protein [Pandoraea terrae]VVD59105.1 naphthalene 1,2-dioxygenase [Pandoraea terrae]